MALTETQILMEDARAEPPAAADFGERQATGRAVLRVDVNLLDHTEMLVAAGFLEQWDDHDRTAIQWATAKMLQALVEEGDTRFEVSVADSA